MLRIRTPPRDQVRRVPLLTLMRSQGVRRRATIKNPRVVAADEAALYRILREELVDRWLKAIREIVLPNYEKPAPFVGDADGQQMQWLLDQVERDINNRLVYQTEKLGVWVTGAGNRNTRQWIDRTKSATGVDVAPYFRLGDIRPYLEATIAENVGLMNRLNADTKARVSQIVFQGFALRKSREQVAREISAAMGITMRHARLIARDQNEKLQAVLNQLRNEQLGIDRYIWRTMLDERVRGNPSGKYPRARPSHWAREGKVFLWARPPQGGHPGFAINCRCTAESVLPDDTR